MTVIVTMVHARKSTLSPGPGRLCAPGIYAWAHRHGLDVGAFAREGLPVEVFERLDDAFAQRLAAIARADAEASNGRQ